MDEQEVISMTAAELEKQVGLSIYKLHLNAQEQPQLACAAGKLAATARYAAKTAKLAVEIARATAAKDIRTNPAKFGLEKVTEASVQEAITLHSDVRAAEVVRIDAEKEADMAAAIQTAFEHRRAALRVESDLFAKEYWSAITPEAGAANVVARADAEQRIRDIRTRHHANIEVDANDR
jgi:hypothetical protein